MNEKVKGGKRAGADGADSDEGQIARIMARALWMQEYTAANPGVTMEDRKTAWKAGRADAMSKHFKSCRKVVAFMQRAGVNMSMAQADADSDGDEA